MLPQDTPYLPMWWGQELPGISTRPRKGTYGGYEFDALPKIRKLFTGNFDWLLNAPIRKDHIDKEIPKENRKSLAALLANCFGRKVDLPVPFLYFFQSKEMRYRIRSCTDCYLDIASDLTPAPLSDGYLVRFLSDSQGVLFWYLFLSHDSSQHAVVVSRRFHDPAPQNWQDPLIEEEVFYCAGSFEEFICRFWIENEIWFRSHQGDSLPNIAEHYIEDCNSSRPG